LLTNSRIADVAVIGVPDEEAGELPKAYVVRKDPALTAKDVKDWVADKVAHFKRIQIVEFVDAVPKSPSGKILRKDLREMEKRNRAPPSDKAKL